MSKLSTSSTKISIALCTYNGAKFLSEQLESFRAQTRLPDELVVRDDCSRDETVKIIEDFVKTAPFPVRLEVNGENLGSTKNFEGAIADCTGDLIFLSDQDDIWLPEKIATIEKNFEINHNLGLIFTDAELIDENSASLGFNLLDFTTTKDERVDLRADNSFEVLLRRNVITGATMAFRSELRRKFVPIPQNIPNLVHDWWIAISCALQMKIDFIEIPLIKYRQHENQQLGIDWGKKQPISLADKFSQNYSARLAFYKNSIEFSQREIERIKTATKFLKNKRKTEDFPKIQLDSLDDFANKFITEKLNMIAHYQARKNLSKNRLKRIFPVLQETLTARYHLFSRGLYSAGRDIFETWK